MTGPATKLAEAFRLGEVLVHVRQYGDGGEGAYVVQFATTQSQMDTLTDEQGFSGLELVDLVSAAQLAGCMLAYLEKRDSLAEFAQAMRAFPDPIEPLIV